MDREIIDTDVLCIGGGPAGLMAAIHAGEMGSRVILAEKGNTLRSGAAATGNDHISCYIPERHGDLKPILRARLGRGLGRHASQLQTLFEQSFEIVKLWESWGLMMTYRGDYEFAGHAYPGSSAPAISMKIHGASLKPTLTKKALEQGVTIMNRVMVSDLIVDNGMIIGAVGVHTRERKIYEFRCKSAVLGTGILTRLYQSPTPGWMFNIGRSPATTGDGRAMAYRAGAELINLELPLRWAGPKYFIRHGKATWVGVLRDPQGRPVGPFVTKPDKKYGDATSDIYTTLFEDYEKSGKGPVYMDCTGISEEDYEYMLHWFRQEGLTSITNYLADEGLDLRKNPVVFTTYEMIPSGGISHNERAETSLKGLYAAGDELQGFSLTGAAGFGWIAGKNAAMRAMETADAYPEKPGEKVEAWGVFLAKILNRDVGATWKEFNIALQQIMNDYAGTVRSETMLEAGLKAVRRLKEKIASESIAENQHELTRLLEVMNLIDMGELVFLMAKERKETRGRHIRVDHPYTNPRMERMLVVKKVDGQPVFEWREVKR